MARGDIKAVLFDLRENSPTHKLLNEFYLGEHGRNIILKIPSGIAHGLKVLGNDAELFYLTSGIYNPAEEGRLSHNDPAIGYDWLKGPDIK